jgi:hypothetical protein
MRGGYRTDIGGVGVLVGVAVAVTVAAPFPGTLVGLPAWTVGGPLVLVAATVTVLVGVAVGVGVAVLVGVIADVGSGVFTTMLGLLLSPVTV